MAFSIRLTEEERNLADSYAKLHSMSMGEAFKRALFERIEDEYDVAVARHTMNTSKAAKRAARSANSGKTSIYELRRPDDPAIRPGI